MNKPLHINVIGIIRAPSADIWKIARNFSQPWDLSSSCRLVEGKDEHQIGAVRQFSVPDDEQVYAERLLEFNDDEQSYSYSMERGPNHLIGYQSRLQFKTIPGKDWTMVVWDGYCSVPKEQQSSVWSQVETVYRTNIQTLATRCGWANFEIPDGIEHALLSGEPRLAVSYKGSGELCLFLHGIGNNRFTWQNQLAALSSLNMCAASIDYRGYGASGDYNGPLTEDVLCSDIERVRKHFQVERLHLVGQSMGSWLALNYYHRFPERVQTLVLSSGSTGLTLADEETRKNFRQLRETPLINGLQPFENSTNVLPNITCIHTDETTQAEILQGLCALRLQTYLSSVRGYCKPTTSFDLQGISVPVTLIAAQLDKGVPPSDMERVATEIPNANFTLINDAGHIANLDQPEAFNRALIRHFQDSTEN